MGAPTCGFPMAGVLGYLAGYTMDADIFADPSVPAVGRAAWGGRCVLGSRTVAGADACDAAVAPVVGAAAVPRSQFWCWGCDGD